MVKAPYSGNPYWNILHNFFILLCPVHIHRTVVNLFNMKKDSTISFFVIVQTFLNSVNHPSLEAERNPPKGTLCVNFINIKAVIYLENHYIQRSLIYFLRFSIA
jgi:hypothetical protein